MNTPHKIISRLALCCLLAIAPILAFGQGAMFFSSNTAHGYTAEQTLGTGCANSSTPLHFVGWIAQSFTTSAAYAITRADINLQISAGSPLTAAVTLELRADSANTPGSVLQTASPTESYTLTGSAVNYPWYFAGYALSPSTRYWISFHGTVDASNYPLWCGATGGSEHSYSSSDGSSWSIGSTGQLIINTYSGG